jgi:hypothetical protein
LVIELAARETCLLTAEGLPPGRDIDVAAGGLDPLWPLRLPPEVRLVFVRRYQGGRGSYWLLEEDGRRLALDMLEDPQGLGPYAFPTTLALRSAGSTAVLAAFRTAKRVRQRSLDAHEWGLVRMLADHKAGAYEHAAAGAFGRRVARELSAALNREGVRPRVVRKARRAQRTHRWARLAVSPTAWLDPPRQAVRLVRRAGLTVLIVGPDGVGKSALADALKEEIRPFLPRASHFHWRPRLLPQPGPLLGRAAMDPATPHDRAPHGRTVSLALLLYYWLDFMVGGWFALRVATVRQRLVLVERGWSDLLVDRRRYRLRVPERLVRALGRALPRPDIVLALEAEPVQVVARKPELPTDEIARQTAAWRRELASEDRAVIVDAGQPLDAVVADAREAVLFALERRAIRKLGAGWVTLPLGAQPRWWLPRGPRRTAHRSFGVHQPTATRGRAGWGLAQVAASAGALRLLPRGPAPPRGVRELVARYVPRRGTLAVARSTHRSRFIALVVGADASPVGVVKVALDEEGREALAREAAHIESLGPLLASPLGAPRIIDKGEGILVLEAVEWQPRSRPDRLPDGVAEALGAFFRAGRGTTHGDFAPWNLLQTESGWILIDWESATRDGDPFFDLFHYVVQSHVLLGRPSSNELIAGVLRSSGAVGEGIDGYARAAGLDPSGAGEWFQRYLDETNEALARAEPGARRALEARRVLASALAADLRTTAATGEERRPGQAARR